MTEAKTLPKRNVRADVASLDDQDRALAILLYSLGFPQHKIASLFGCNQGRVNEAVKPFRSDDKSNTPSPDPNH